MRRTRPMSPRTLMPAALLAALALSLPTAASAATCDPTIDCNPPPVQCIDPNTGQPCDPFQWFAFLGCPDTTETQCLDPSYKSTDCGFWQGKIDLLDRGSVCNQTYLSNLTDTYDSLDQRPQTVYQPGAPAGQNPLTRAKVIAFTPDTAFYDGDDGLYLSVILAEQRRRLNPQPGDHPTERDRWDGNGTTVRSCQEYVYEKYYDYSVFEDETLALGRDYEAIYDLAFDPGQFQIAFKTLADKGGDPMTEQIAFPAKIQGMPDGVVPKNAFMRALPDSNGGSISDVDRFVFDTGLDAFFSSDPAALPTYTPSWSWHKKMGDYLLGDVRSRGGRTHSRHNPNRVPPGGFGQEEMDAWIVKQRRYADLLAQQQDLWAAIQQVLLPNPSGNGQPNLGQRAWWQDDPRYGDFSPALVQGTDFPTPFDPLQVPDYAAVSALFDKPHNNPGDPFPIGGALKPLAVALYIVNRELNTSLLDANANGCLAARTPSKCDWSPRTFVPRVLAQFLKQREERYHTCLKYTQNDFSAASVVRNAHVSGVNTSVTNSNPFTNTIDDMTSDASGFFKFGATSLMDLFLREVPQVTQKQSFVASLDGSGSQVPGHQKSDSTRVGPSDYNLAFGYTLGWELDGYQKACSSTLDMGGSVYATATAFGRGPADLARFSAGLKSAQTASGDPGYRADLTLMIGPIQVVGINDIFSTVQGDTVQQQRDLIAGTIPIFIGPIPLLLTGGISTVTGLEYKLSGSRSTCSADAQVGDTSLQIGLDATMRPFVGAKAFANVSLEAVLAAAGVGAELTIIELSLPLTLGMHVAHVQGEKGPGPLVLSGKATLDLELHALDGNIKAWVRFGPKFLSHTIEKSIISWSGPNLPPTSLLNETELIPINFLKAPGAN